MASGDAHAVLDVRGLGRHYGRLSRVDAVRNVSFAVARGEIFGLIGPDGAGKTSIIQTLAGVLRPHAGAASVLGLDVARHAERVKHRLGYMPQGLGSNLYDSLTVDENIEFFRDLHRLPSQVYESNRAELLAVTRLERFLDRRAAHLSGGMRQKLALICTLIHLPEVLLLDEPTTGVDPISRRDFWQIVQRVVHERATTVLLSTSYMDEAERCHRIALLHAGEIIALGTPDAVRGQSRSRYVRVVASPQASALACLRSSPAVIASEVLGDEIHVRCNGDPSVLAAHLRAGSAAVHEMVERPATLEDVFLEQLQSERPGPAAVPLVRRLAAGGASVECTHVSCRFGPFRAVDDVTLALRSGEILGLLGPNGAGKTTLIKMMCGLLPPTAGSIEIGGVDVRTERERVWSAIGYMSQRFSLYRDLTVRQNLQLYADLYCLPRQVYQEGAAHLGLDPYLARLTSDLPNGVRQRAALLCAVLHQPKVVFLDEPTAGVDPQARRLFWDLIYSLSRDGGVTVLVSTHYMDEAAHCDRLALMHQGRLVADGAPAKLQQRAGVRRSIEDAFIDYVQAAEAHAT